MLTAGEIGRPIRNGQDGNAGVLHLAREHGAAAENAGSQFPRHCQWGLSRGTLGYETMMASGETGSSVGGRHERRWLLWLMFEMEVATCTPPLGLTAGASLNVDINKWH